MRNVLAIILVVLLVGMAAGQVAANPKIQTVAARYTPPASGRAMFDAYCASCHGADGRGSGPAALAMKNGVPDITKLAKSHGGVFPAMHVTQEIMGDVRSAAHGSKDMPVWGPVFLRMGQQSNAEIHQRVYNLTAYVESLQLK